MDIYIYIYACDERHVGFIFRLVQSSRPKKDQHLHLRSSQRQYVAKELLESIVYPCEQSGVAHFVHAVASKLFGSYNRHHNMSLIRLLKEGVLRSAYPLHDVIK